MKNLVPELRDLQAIASVVCVNNGCPRLADEIDFQWSRALRSSMAEANLRTKTIKLSIKMFLKGPIEDQTQGITREVCRLIAWHLYQDSSHQKGWKTCMERAGYPNAAF